MACNESDSWLGPEGWDTTTPTRRARFENMNSVPSATSSPCSSCEGAPPLRSLTRCKKPPAHQSKGYSDKCKKCCEHIPNWSHCNLQDWRPCRSRIDLEFRRWRDRLQS